MALIRGAYGVIPFMSSTNFVQTFDKVQHSESGNWLESKPIGGTPKLIWNGRALGTITIKVLLMSSLGVRPFVIKKALETYNKLGLKMPLLFPDYRGMFVLSSFTSDEKAWGKWGMANTIEINLNLKEYN